MKAIKVLPFPLTRCLSTSHSYCRLAYSLAKFLWLIWLSWPGTFTNHLHYPHLTSVFCYVLIDLCHVALILNKILWQCRMWQWADRHSDNANTTFSAQDISPHFRRLVPGLLPTALGHTQGILWLLWFLWASTETRNKNRRAHTWERLRSLFEPKVIYPEVFGTIKQPVETKNHYHSA